MPKMKFIIFIGFAVLIVSCAQLRTKQYVMPTNEKGEEPNLKTAGGWTFLHPKFVAFKDAADMSEVRNPSMYWLTLQAQFKNKEKENVVGDIEIDSVIVHSFKDAKKIIKYPSRVAEFDSNTGKYHIKVYNFFEDQGIEFEVNNDSVKIEFTVDFLEADSSVILEYVMYRNVKLSTIPFSPR